MDLEQFKEPNDYAKGKGSGIFQYGNLTTFEKMLFLQYNVTELITLLKRKNVHIKKLEEVIVRNFDEGYVKDIELVDEDDSDSARNRKLKAEIAKLHKLVDSQRKSYKKLLDKLYEK